ncbi:MAG: hypothetical protein IJT36_00735 [Alphaproteobacteria bacterium]|nr:hypothetical protein [Alphaproteobacteria bacterium]
MKAKHAESEANEVVDWENASFRAVKKKRESIVTVNSELLLRRINADYSGKNSLKINNSHR